jgi:hypothetical protein
MKFFPNTSMLIEKKILHGRSEIQFENFLTMKSGK